MTLTESAVRSQLALGWGIEAFLVARMCRTPMPAVGLIDHATLSIHRYPTR